MMRGKIKPLDFYYHNAYGHQTWQSYMILQRMILEITRQVKYFKSPLAVDQ